MIWTALILGFLGSFHCLGMCGPIALAVSAADSKSFWWRKLWYNLGRTLTYGALGLLIGFVGQGFQLVGLQQWVSILLGGVIIIFALLYKRSERALASGGMYGLVAKVKSSLGYWLKKGGTTAFFMTGLVNGFLPCGMVYIALLASLALSNPWQGAMYMVAFGLGTLPLLFLLMVGSDVFSPMWRQRLFKMMPYFAVLIGVLFIFRGLGLGIHFLSPELGGFDLTAGASEMTICK
ncbi:sulfite exporter TauE/SafE family protein [Echinicola strongylocentroti]|uniref:Sulfite exporter TauE/SafE family protein n=1 Tax=Echinicola strongylocentroti TaxID=1795355 RepID=A0A2Z4INN3_9BACT|nr:sulfite exporter TauE/SafE family protein [Echinicola strongylocentroti]AWW32387.1 sulfite exporter TauE/SafE family protein [Echinicola strongylocentroti]